MTNFQESERSEATENWSRTSGGEGGGFPPHNWELLRNEKVVSYGKMNKKTIRDGDFDWKGAHNMCDLGRFLNLKIVRKK